ncbi:MAG: HAMP domain-containing histidine kinase, partial [Nitrospinae bacterium]|nr:HAMP domain-containing histidine kinase [Nitrospinota bacterium]
GALFGFLFPLAAAVIESTNSYGSLTWVNAAKVQSENVLIWIIDSAPFWLGLFARLGGARQDILLTQSSLIRKELNLSQEDAEKAHQAKSEFLARMSHELRTPMNAILGFTQLLQMDKNNPLVDYQQKNMERVSSAGHHLLKLINEILDLSKIESGEIDISIDTHDLVPIVDDVISISIPLADEKGLTLEYDGFKGNSCYAKVDPLRFKQVVLNLISNAIKYNKPNGSVIVTCEIQDSGSLRLGIEDKGYGIPEEKKELLFKPFERLDMANNQLPGVGTGLVIARKFIELMGGKINVESVMGEGSFFYIDIPVLNKEAGLMINEMSNLPAV